MIRTQGAVLQPGDYTAVRIPGTSYHFSQAACRSPFVIQILTTRYMPYKMSTTL
jgi:hypothetical protein